MEISCQVLLNDYSLAPLYRDDISRSAYLLALFDSSQLRKIELPISDVHQLASTSDFGTGTAQVFSLSSNKRFLIDRLDIFGITEEICKDDFIKAKQNHLDQIKRSISAHDIKKNDNYPDFDAFPNKNNKYDFIQKSSLSDFTSVSKKIIINQKRKILFEENNQRKFIIPHDVQNPLERHLIADSFYSFPFTNHLCFIRNMLRKFGNDTEIQMIFEGEEVESKLIELFESINSDTKIGNQVGKEIFILTEGVTDSEFLKNSLGILYPHLTDIFTFPMSSNKGSASMLERRIESLSLTKTKNKVIGVFDNDDAAFPYYERSKDISLPQNFRVIRYPNLEFAKKYPVYTDTGDITYEDINGVGMCIELYLGEEILKSEGNYFPITIKKGQGKLKPKIKKYIQEKFRKKISNYLIDSSTSDWGGIKSILSKIFTVFN